MYYSQSSGLIVKLGIISALVISGHLSLSSNVLSNNRDCEHCPKIIVFEFDSVRADLTIAYGDEKTNLPLIISKFDYEIKYEIRDEYGRVVFKHTSSETSIILNLKEIEDSGVYSLSIRPGRLGIMIYRLSKN